MSEQITLEDARQRSLPGWNLRCNRCGSFGASWCPGLRTGWGALALCPICKGLVDTEIERHRHEMGKLCAVHYEQPRKGLVDAPAPPAGEGAG